MATAAKCKVTLPWAGLDCGLLGGNGLAIRQCSAEFLSAISDAYLKEFWGGNKDLEPKDAEFEFDCLLRELCRLWKYPTLFPTPAAHERFVKILQDVVQLKSNFSKEDREKAEDSFRLRANQLAMEEAELIQAVNRPTFKPDLLPWEQFLFKGSPGSGVTLPSVPPNQMLLLVPMGGVLLLANWMRRRNITEKKCREAHIPDDILAKFQGESPDSAPREPMPSSGLRYRQTLVTITPNPYYDHWHPVPKNNTVVDRLESFNSVIEQLEGDELTQTNLERGSYQAMYYRCIKDDMDTLPSQDD
ncbi:hypothetical protein FQN57_004852 [Myotisia sp. PD_48]|nr:hypothetical protein FQN57_004852 [Myotisia sp. PD_48]